MLDQNQIKEISRFMGTFLQAFDLFVTAYGNKSGDSDHVLSEPLKAAAYKVTGTISGYLSAVYKGGNIDTATLNNQYYAERLISLYYTAASQTDRSTGIKLEVADSALPDETMYSVRKSKPQMTIRIQVNNYIIDFFAFPVKDEWQQKMKRPDNSSF